MNEFLLSRRMAIGAVAGLVTLPSVSAWHNELLGFETSESPNFDTSETVRDQRTNSLPIRILLNENPLGCSPLAKKAAEQALSRANFYPFDTSISLANKLRAKHGLPLLAEPKGISSKIVPDEGTHALSLAGGSSELLLSAALAYCLDGGNIVEPDPSYQALGVASQKRPGPAVELRRIPLLSDGGLDLDRMLAAIDSNTRVVVVTNPNNPTGTALKRSSLLAFIDKVPSKSLIVVDEAYVDFLDDPESHSMIPESLRRDNVLIARTFSKIHGLAGLRIGYAVGHRSILERMQPFRVGSFSLNTCGIAAAIASLDDVDFQNSSRKMAAESRQRIMTQLSSLGFRVARSDAACVWADWGRDTTQLVSSLAEKGVMIASGIRWDAPNCIRISVATPWQTTKLLETITEAVKA